MHASISSIALMLFLSLFCACQPKEQAPTFDEQEVIQEVEAAVEAFFVADTSRNAGAVLDLLWPDYTMLADGQRITYEEVAAGSPAFMASLAVFYTEWTALEIIPIAEHAALSSFLFRDSLVSREGVVTKKRGPTTLYWEKRKGQWKARYGDADHYPW